MAAGADKGNFLQGFVYSIKQYPIRLYMAVPIAFEIACKRMVTVSAFKGLLVDEAAHDGIQLLNIFAPLHQKPVIPLKLPGCLKSAQL